MQLAGELRVTTHRKRNLQSQLGHDESGCVQYSGGQMSALRPVLSNSNG